MLAVCGWSGSGKTTLLERVLPALREKGLAVVVIKHDVHGIEVDRPGKDSDRLFHAGADVILRGPGEVLHRIHAGTVGDLGTALPAALADHDLVLVEGHRDTPLPKVWLARHDDPAPPPDVTDVRAVLDWGSDRPAALLALLDATLEEGLRAVPVLGGVLVGGASTRMGTPKGLLVRRGVSFAERAVAALDPLVSRVVLLGHGQVAAACRSLPRLADPPGLAGPLAGMLAALRWAPGHAWVFAPCDLPAITPEAVRWLLARRAPGRWAVLARNDSGVEPLLALYEPQAGGPLEALAGGGERAPKLIAGHPKTTVALPPVELRGAWRNINTPEQLAEFERETGGPDTH